MSGSPRRRVTSEDIAAQLIRLIDGKVYQPGDRLREQELAARFGVSRGPVREALRSLEAKSLVKIEPMRGASVARLTDEDARDMVEISAALFALTAARAARACPADTKRLEHDLASLKSMVDDGSNARDFFRQTLRLGISTMKLANSPKLSAHLSDARIGAPDMFGPLGFTTEGLRRTAVAKWERLVDAIKAGDPDSASRLAWEVHIDALQAALEIVG